MMVTGDARIRCTTRKDTDEVSDSKDISISVGRGLPWFTLWIFTIAFANLCFYQGVLALAIWPYYLGEAIATVVGR
jgi:hypothetical protein